MFDSIYKNKTALITDYKGLKDSRVVIWLKESSADCLVPDCSRPMIRQQFIGIRSPHAVHSWQHGLEPLGRYLRHGTFLSEDLRKYGGAWNLGPHDSRHLTVSEI